MPCFNYETTPKYELNISLSDGTFTIYDILTVNILDSVNTAPEFTNLPNATSLSEDADAGVTVFTAKAIDTNPCDVITYALQTAGVPFVLDSSSKLAFHYNYKI